VDRADVLTLWGYNSWANEQIFAAAGRLHEEELRNPVASGHGSLFGTLLHLVDTEYGWRVRLEAGADTPVLTEQDIPDLAALAARSRAEADAWRAYLATLTDADLGGTLRYDVEGQPRERVRWHVIVHVMNHGTYHRGEIAAALTALGRSPGELDFTIFLRS
jgi:uncharacterized damage-inducible protein DinB